MDLFESSINDGNLEFGEVETEASDEDLNEVADHDLALNPVSHVDGSDGTIIEDSHDEDIVKNDVLVGEPYLGMEFDSVDAAKIHYKTYALSLGFSICLGTKYNAKRKGGMVTGRTFMCSKGTIRPIRRYGRGVSNDNIMRSNMTPNVVVPTMRPHCKAHLRVRMKEGGKWIVTGFVKDHNHELQVNNENPLSPVPERLVKTDFVHEVSAQQPQILSHVTPRSSGSRNTSFTDSSNYSVKASKESFGNDVVTTLAYFRRLQVENPSFYYAIQVDDSNRMRNIFWADGRSRTAYKHFGDAIRFDTTCLKNKYDMPFALFMGVNHHLQPTLFGCALIKDETASSFAWLFETWLESMGGRHPISIMTDHNSAMKKAIAEVLPTTRHLFCEGHILKNVKRNLGHVYKTHLVFGQELEDCVNGPSTSEEFESAWKDLVQKYELKGNAYLKELFNIRHQWVPACFKDTFVAQISVIQRSESINAVFDGFVDPQTSIYCFVKQYEKVLENLFEKEAHEDLKTIQVKPSLWSNHPIEEHAREVYTRTLFEKLKEQLKSTMDFDIEDHGNGRYTVVKIKGGGKTYDVATNISEGKVTCSCRLFESSGLLCSHTLLVFRQLKIHEVPLHYILKRWTRKAKEGLDLDGGIVQNHSQAPTPQLTRYNNVCQYILKLAGDSSTCEESYQYVMQIMKTAEKGVTAIKERIAKDRGMQETTTSTSQVTTNASEDFTTLDPTKMSTEGRKRMVRSSIPLEEKGRAKNIRSCSRCKETGHNIHTCKKVLTGVSDQPMNTIELELQSVYKRKSSGNGTERRTGIIRNDPYNDPFTVFNQVGKYPYGFSS